MTWTAQDIVVAGSVITGVLTALVAAVGAMANALVKAYREIAEIRAMAHDNAKAIEGNSDAIVQAHDRVTEVATMALDVTPNRDIPAMIAAASQQVPTVTVDIGNKTREITRTDGGLH